MLQLRKNEISLRRWSGGAAQLRTSDSKVVPNLGFANPRGVLG